MAWKRSKFEVIIVILALFAVSFLAAGIFVMSPYWYHGTRYDEVAERSFDPPDDDSGDETVSSSVLLDTRIDWDYLEEINPDIVAWVYVPGTPISYPVCWSGDDRYLNRDFDGNQDWREGFGCIYLEGLCKPDFSGDVNYIYGHHMDDGSMFACIASFAASDVFESHRHVYLFTRTGAYDYKTFAMVLPTGDEPFVAPEAEKLGVAAEMMRRSVVTPSEGFPKPEEVAKILFLSTCDYTQRNGRAALTCRLVATTVPEEVEAARAEDMGDLVELVSGQ